MTAEPRRHYYIKTYGCQMNVYDSDRMADILAERGMTATDSPERADLILLNTCHIREKAAEKVYSEIGRLRRIKQQRAKSGKDTIIAVAGCVAQAEGEAMVARAPIVDLVVGPQAYHRLPALLARIEARPGAVRGAVIDTDFPPEDKFTALPQRRRRGATSAFLTVQEGCDKFCTFCVVPYTRGAESSRPVAMVIDEARELVATGVREITLLGQNVNAYHGAGRNGAIYSLAALIRRLAEIGGLDRIRYTTSHPRDMDDGLIAAHADVPALMPYLHLPVQSGSDRILAAMNRGHGRADYLDIIDRLRAARPDLALSGDFIVGFPGESEADFAATLSLVEAVGYAQAYSFKYSPRPGTPAADKDGQVAEDIKAGRLARLQDLLGRQQSAFNRASVGKTVPVLFERQGRKPGQLVGRSPWMQAVHCTLSAERAGALRGQIRMVTLTAAGPNSLAGVLAGVPVDGLSDHQTGASDNVAAAASGGL